MKQAVRWLCVLLGVFVSSIGVAHAAIVAAGIQHTVYVSPDGQVWTWGHNYYGQLGLGADASNGIYASPMPVPGMSDVKAVAAGDYSTFVLKNDGTVWAWGANGGLLGGGSLPNEFAPVQVTGLSNIVELRKPIGRGAGAISLAITRRPHERWILLGCGRSQKPSTS